MENTLGFQPEKSLDYDSLFLASIILLNVSRTISNIQMIVAVVLRYAGLGVSITNSLIGLILPNVSEEE
jgi:hypothetical protein